MISARGPDSASADEPGMDVRAPLLRVARQTPDVSTYFVITGGCEDRLLFRATYFSDFCLCKRSDVFATVLGTPSLHQRIPFLAATRPETTSSSHRRPCAMALTR